MSAFFILPDAEAGDAKDKLFIRTITGVQEITAAQVADMIDVIGWYTSFYHDVAEVAPEYFERCADLNAVNYLYGEVQRLAAALRP